MNERHLIVIVLFVALGAVSMAMFRSSTSVPTGATVSTSAGGSSAGSASGQRQGFVSDAVPPINSTATDTPARRFNSPSDSLLATPTPQRRSAKPIGGTQGPVGGATVNAATGQPIVDEPFARAALNLVGVDASAEGVWATAINDPSMDPNQRKDLIEDLNETGFEDPKNLTRADLPLIVSRLELIEQYAPTAMDDVNVAAFGEAYKDLAGMYVKASSSPN
jgi:hypothetical protein